MEASDRLKAQRDTGKNKQILGVPGGRETVLVIDDEPVILNLTKKILALYGYTVLIAESGARGLELFHENAADVQAVLLDINMPKMSGTEVMQRLLEEKPSLRIILISGRAEVRFIDGDNILAKARDVIHKPFQIKELAEVVRAVLDAPSSVYSE